MANCVVCGNKTSANGYADRGGQCPPCQKTMKKMVAELKKQS